MKRQKDRQMGVRIDRQTDKKMEGWIGQWMDRQTDIICK